MAKQVVGLFDNMQDAHGAVQALRDAGFGADDISVVANNASGGYDTTSGDSEAAEGAAAGATGGAVLGGLGGLLVGLGALAIPGIGPVVAAGSLATALGTTAVGAGLGAAAGGLVGALVGAGIPEDDANVYAEGVRRGGALVTVQAASDSDADRAADILDSYNVVDIDDRGTNYRSSGWSGFDESSGTYGGGDSNQSAWEESSKVGTVGGTVAGAATGAAIGGAGAAGGAATGAAIGTAGGGPIGAVVGGLAGAAVGAAVGAAGDSAGEAAADAATGEDDYNRSSTMNTGTAGGAAIGSATDYGTTGATTGYSTTGTTGSGFQSGTQNISADQGEIAIPVVEEEIRVGKREVESGGVRVETRVEETPVNEQVTLRDEQVRVERRAVDQPVDASTVTNAFQEGTFEVRERDEQAVVQKEARVVEEVVINKETQQRTETIQDTVRRTDVDVQEIGGQTTTTGFTETSSTMGTSGTGVGGTMGTGTNEGAIESGLGNLGSGTERATGLDLDQSGGVGDRDRSNNY